MKTFNNYTILHKSLMEYHREHGTILSLGW